ncbi:MAG: NAD(P)-dependent oxidoreductase [Elusimicrobiota bacterium]
MASSTKTMKIILTGSNGFVGSHLKEALLKLPNAAIYCLVRRESKLSAFNISNTEQVPIDYSDVNKLAENNVFDNCDYIFHVAGITKGITEDDFFSGNFLPTYNLLEALKRRGVKPKRFVLVSSLAAAGPAKNLNEPVTSLAKPSPIEYYGQSKLRAEEILNKYSNSAPFTIIRPSAVYGPRDRDFLKLFQSISRGLNIFYGNRDKYLSLIYIDDLIAGIIEAGMSNKTSGAIYNLANDTPITWETLHKEIILNTNIKMFTCDIPYFFLETAGLIGSVYSILTKKYSLINMQKVKLAKPHYWICSNTEAKNDFGFNTKTTLKDGIAKTYEWYKSNHWL